jgi:REP element-mobilizing transposase RayT
MAQTLTNLLVHVVFSTKDRRPLITADLKPNVLAYVGGIVRELDGILLTANGTSDHVHLLMRLPPTIALAGAIRIVKTNSTRWVHETQKGHEQFRWQAGYAAFSVSESNVPEMTHYIRNQVQRHRRISF